MWRPHDRLKMLTYNNFPWFQHGILGVCPCRVNVSDISTGGREGAQCLEGTSISWWLIPSYHNRHHGLHVSQAVFSKGECIHIISKANNLNCWSQHFFFSQKKTQTKPKEGGGADNEAQSRPGSHKSWCKTDLQQRTAMLLCEAEFQRGHIHLWGSWSERDLKDGLSLFHNR